MFYYMEPVTFYWTKAKSLNGCVVTDKENYFLGLQPVPFPEKPLGKKLTEDLELKLSNDKVCKLGQYDARYMKNDSILEILYLIKENDLKDLLNFEVVSASVTMSKEEGVRTYVFKLHKSALREQLACFLKEAEKKKKK